MGDTELPSGVVTFVLTDVVESTKLWEGSSDTMPAALAIHEALIDKAVTANAGVVLKARGEGDSTFSVFQRASDALRAAYEAQIDLTSADWPSGAALAVRCAIHTGEATETGGDYVGVTVNRAARIRSVAEGGEILVSAAAAQLVADHLPVDTHLSTLGEVRLRDLSRPEEVFVLTGPGLRPPGGDSRGEHLTDLLTERGVTRRERDVLDGVSKRLTNAEIAETLSVSKRTVETHVSSLLRRLDVENRIELAKLAATLAASAAPRSLPPALDLAAQRSSCIGRQEERSQLLRDWERAATGQTLLTMVTGEAGIGKSRLVAELAVDVYTRGGRVLLGTCADGSQVSYQPFVEALAEDAETAPEGVLRERVGPHAEVLAGVLPELGQRLGAVPRQVQADPLVIRAEIERALRDYLTRSAVDHPTLLVVEDLHWASPSTRDALLHLARTTNAAPLLVVATSRDTAPDLDAELGVFVADVARLPAGSHLSLPGLDVASAGQVIVEVGGDLDPSAAVTQTGGNPLFLREMAMAGETSRTLQGILAQRYARMADDDLDVLDTAVALGAEFDTDLLATASGRDVPAVLATLDRAEAGGIVVPVGGRPGRFGFVHALFRSVRYEELTSSRRMQLHAAAARALTPRADDPRVLPELASHACISAPLGDATRAVELARRAASQAAAAGDSAQEAVHYRRALDVFDFILAPDERLRLDLGIRMGAALARIDTREARKVLTAACRQARSLDDVVAFADAVFAMTMEFGGSVTPGRDDPEWIALAEEALEILGDDHPTWSLRIQASLGMHLFIGSNPVRGGELAHEAVAGARRLGDPATLISTLVSMSYCHGPFEMEEYRANAEELIALGRQTGSGLALKQGFGQARRAARQRGDFAEMRRLHGKALESSPVQPFNDLQHEGCVAIVEGDLATARELMRRVRDITEPLGMAVVYSGSLYLQIEAYEGRNHTGGLEAIRLVDGFAKHVSEAMLVLAYLRNGRLEEASVLFAERRDEGFEKVPRTMTWATAMAAYTEAAAWLGDRTALADLLACLDPLAGSIADSGGMLYAPIDDVRAMAMLALDDSAGAAEAAASAIDASRERGTFAFLGRELVVLAAARRQLGADDDEVDALLSEALEIADSTGAVLIRQEAERYGLVPAT